MWMRTDLGKSFFLAHEQHSNLDHLLLLHAKWIFTGDQGNVERRYAFAEILIENSNNLN